MPFKTIDEGLAHLRKYDQALMEIGHSTLMAGGKALYPIDFYVIGAVKRGLSIAAGFRVLIEGRNLVCAGALLRMQLESAFRFFGLSMVEKPHDAAMAILSGTPMGKLKTRDGNLLRDRYLAKELSKHHPWVESVYVETSKFVHFTEKQIFAGLIATNDEERTFEMLIAPRDSHAPDAVFLEALDAFDATTGLLIELIDSWREAKDQFSPRDAV